MELNLIGALTMFKTMDMMPNFSELARTFGRDRHTIKKMHEGKRRKRRKKRASELDAHVEERVLVEPAIEARGPAFGGDVLHVHLPFVAGVLRDVALLIVPSFGIWERNRLPLLFHIV